MTAPTPDEAAAMVARLTMNEPLLPWPELSQDMAFIAFTIRDLRARLAAQQPVIDAAEAWDAAWVMGTAGVREGTALHNALVRYESTPRAALGSAEADAPAESPMHGEHDPCRCGSCMTTEQRRRAEAGTPAAEPEHRVTLHWDDDTGDVVMRECICGERWHHDEDTRCPEDDSEDFGLTEAERQASALSTPAAEPAPDRCDVYVQTVPDCPPVIRTRGVEDGVNVDYDPVTGVTLGVEIVGAHSVQVNGRVVSGAGAPTEPADPVRDALAELVSLKDGPRDHRYRARKDWAWSNARRALTAAGIPTTADVGKKLVAAQDGKPGCPAEVWDDGIYRNRCSRGIDECGRHGKFAVRPADDTREET